MEKRHQDDCHPLKRWLLEHELTVQSLAELLAADGIVRNPRSLRNIINGHRFMGRKTAKAISKITNGELSAEALQDFGTEVRESGEAA